MEAGVAIVQAGERGGWLGRLDLECREGTLSRTGYTLIPIDAASPADPEIAAEVQRSAASANQEMDQEVGTSVRELSAWRELIRRALGNKGI
jgi:2',3'-cyclic-nucleotide 2'-phosphodiesterase (5'-nucleotidase family)